MWVEEWPEMERGEIQGSISAFELAFTWEPSEGESPHKSSLKNLGPIVTGM